MMIKSLFLVLFSSIFSENCILLRMFGICSMINQKNRPKYVIRAGSLTTIVILLSTIVNWPIYKYFLFPKDLLFLQMIIFPLIILLIIELAKISLKKFKFFSDILPDLSINCLILGISLTNISNSIANPEFKLLHSIIYSVGAGMGFIFVMIVFTCILNHIKQDKIPLPFQGTPIKLIIASIMSLSFIGISNLIK